jgi:hypothetical protein
MTMTMTMTGPLTRYLSPAADFLRGLDPDASDAVRCVLQPQPVEPCFQLEDLPPSLVQFHGNLSTGNELSNPLTLLFSSPFELEGRP